MACPPPASVSSCLQIGAIDSDVHGDTQCPVRVAFLRVEGKRMRHGHGEEEDGEGQKADGEVTITDQLRWA